MSADPTLPSRYEMLVERKRLDGRVMILLSRRTYWQALTRAVAALSREYVHDDPELAKFMSDLSFRSVKQERAVVGELDSHTRQLERINEALRASDATMTPAQMAAENETLYGGDNYGR